MDQRHAVRVSEINQRYRAQLREQLAPWNKLAESIDEQRQFLVKVVPGSNYVPAEPVRDRFIAHWNECTTYGDDLRAECTSRFNTLYFEALANRYYRADRNWVLAQLKDSAAGVDIEALLAFSHNTEILSSIAAKKAEIEQQKAEITQRIRARRNAEVDRSAAARDEEIEAADESRRRALRAISAGLQAFGNSMQTQPVVMHGDSCTSDYACSAGYVCIKPNYSATGTCLRAVTSTGLPTYERRISSSGMKVPQSTDCHSSFDCPVSFQCDATSGACLRR